jgi:hypothetical protein
MNGIFNEFEIPVHEKLCNNITVDKKGFHKMIFILNALEKGWKIKKIKDSYIFTKKHEGKKEIYHDSYLENFLSSNLG